MRFRFVKLSPGTATVRGLGITFWWSTPRAVNQFCYIKIDLGGNYLVIDFTKRIR